MLKYDFGIKLVLILGSQIEINFSRRFSESNKSLSLAKSEIKTSLRRT